MGHPKLLLRLGRKSLLRRAVESAQSVCERVIVVLGADADRLGAELVGIDVHLVHNPYYAEGLSSSLRQGVEAVGSARAVLVTLADQPLVTVDNLRGLVAEYERSGAPIVAATYADTVGVPAIFDRSLFGELTGLRGDAGAKAVIEAHRGECRLVPIPAAATDLDTPEDWERATRKGAHPSDSGEQREVEEYVLDLLSKEIGVRVSRHRFRCGQSTVEVDGYSSDTPTLCEVFAHVGPVKAGQVKKVLADAFKLVYLAARLAPKGAARKLLVFVDHQAATPFQTGTWYAEALKDLGVDVHVIPLPEERITVLRRAQVRQYR